MKLFLKRTKSSDNMRFIVSDRSGNDVYSVYSLGANTFLERLVLSDTNGITLADIKVSPMKAFNAFRVKTDRDGFLLTFTMGEKTSFRLYGLNWCIKAGDTLGVYEVYDVDNTLLMKQVGKNFSTKGYCELDIYTETRQMLCVAMAVCMNFVNYIDITMAAPI